MTKLTLSSIGSFSQSAITTINQNMDDIETAIENTLSRDGTTPNQMTADLDMNNNDIVNVDNIYVENIVLDGAVLVPATIGSGTSTAILNAIGPSIVRDIDSRAALQALDTTLFTKANFDGSVWTFVSGDYSARVAADTLQAIYIKATAISAASGAWVRAYGTRIFPTWFGAVGDGVTNDTTALSACLNFGLPVFLNGQFRITSNVSIALTSTIRNLSIHGGGRNFSAIVLDAANVGIQVTIAGMAVPWGTATQAVDLQDFEIVPKNTSTIAALKITGQPAIGSTEKSFFIKNVNIVPTSTTTYTTNGFEFFDCRNSNIKDCVINGSYATFTGSGIKWWGSTGSAPVGLLVEGCQINWWSKGIEAAPNSGGTTTGGNDWQGVTVTNCIMLACDYGIHATSVDNFAEYLTVTGCHLNSRTAGIYATDVGLVYISDNYFLFLGTAPGGTSYGIYTQINNFAGYKAQFGQITNNSMSFGAAGAVAKVGIYAKTGGTNMWTVLRDNVFISQTVDYDTSDSNWLWHQDTTGAWHARGGATGYSFSIENLDASAVTTKYAQFSYYGRNTSNVRKHVADHRITPADTQWQGSNYDLYLNNAGTLASVFNVNGTTGVFTIPGVLVLGGGALTSGPISPGSNDAAALGQPTFAWSDLYLASGAVLNFNNGNVLVTHSAGVLTFTGSSSCSISASGFLGASGFVFSSSATAGLGYATGAGGTVTQGTSRTTAVTLNKVSGAITMFTAAGSATPASFTVNNSAVAATDTIVLNIKSGATNTYFYFVTAVAAGSFVITFWTTGGTASDTPILTYNVIKGVTS